MIALATLAPEVYVREVLPKSASLWAGNRDPDVYVAELLAIAQSGWGRRRFRTVGLRDDGALVASCKRYARVFRCGERKYTGAGIGAVFTPTELRGRGYATALLGAFLDAERAAGSDFAYLFSDIHPAFYERLGFVPLPSRAISLRADALPSDRLNLVTLGEDDDGAIRRTFDSLENRRAFSFVRSPLDWEWQRLRASSAEYAGAYVRLGVRRGRTLAAYVAGRRIPASDAFVLDEYAFARLDDAPMLGPLLRSAAGDLRTVKGWLPPTVARDALPAGAVRRRTSGISMIVPLSSPFRAAFSAQLAAIRKDRADVCWATDQV